MNPTLKKFKIQMKKEIAAYKEKYHANMKEAVHQYRTKIHAAFDRLEVRLKTKGGLPKA